MHIRKVDIRPGVSVLSVLRHLNYRPWYAIAEFVDNSVQSFLTNRERLRTLDGSRSRLRVRIDIDATPPARLSVKDNAGGIASTDYSRAFRPAAVPPDRSGLSEFGMGMKSAACWFAPRWYVRTSAADESVERVVRFDIAQIVHDQLGELAIEETIVATDTHFTEVVLQDLYQVPQGRTVGKIKEHLTDIYRVFLRENLLELVFNGEALAYSEPPVLNAPYFKDPRGRPVAWRKEITFDLGNGLSVAGFAAIRETANVSRAGFALFRRKRLIQGGGDEGYRPELIFGKSNSYRYQRLFGELHLEGFDVSHTKDGFRWDQNEQPFLELLKEHLDSTEMPLLRQAEGHRVRASRDQLTIAAHAAVNHVVDVMEASLPHVLPGLADAPPADTRATMLDPGQPIASRELSFEFRRRLWMIRVELSNDPAESEWMALSNVEAPAEGPRRMEIRVSLAHPFMVRFAQADPENVEALLRVAAALGVAEVTARDAGVKLAGTIRRNLNDLLREALAAP